MTDQVVISVVRMDKFPPQTFPGSSLDCWCCNRWHLECWQGIWATGISRKEDKREEQLQAPRSAKHCDSSSIPMLSHLIFSNSPTGGKKNCFSISQGVPTISEKNHSIHLENSGSVKVSYLGWVIWRGALSYLIHKMPTENRPTQTLTQTLLQKTSWLSHFQIECCYRYFVTKLSLKEYKNLTTSHAARKTNWNLGFFPQILLICQMLNWQICSCEYGVVLKASTINFGINLLRVLILKYHDFYVNLATQLLEFKKHAGINQI